VLGEEVSDPNANDVDGASTGTILISNAVEENVSPEAWLLDSQTSIVSVDPATMDLLWILITRAAHDVADITPVKIPASNNMRNFISNFLVLNIQSSRSSPPISLIGWNWFCINTM
jgi:hypothetical protein